MTIRKTAALSLLATLLFLSAPPRSESAERYNFVVIMADDLGARELACYGNTRHATPELDRLATEGTRFRTCYATPICTSTRVLIMTGQYPHRTGYYNFLKRAYSPRPGTPSYDIGSKTTFGDILKAGGYATAAAGKWQLTGELPSLVRDCGFDNYCMWSWLHKLPAGAKHEGRFEGRNKPARFWYPAILQDGKYREPSEKDYGPDIYTDYLIAFIKKNKKKPFVAYYPMALTHTPWEPTPDLGKPGKKTPRGLRSNVEYMDHLVGRIVRAIDSEGLKEKTIIIFTGDNGTQGAGKATVTELGARVPLIVRCPGTVRPGIVTDELADLSDILPTLVEFSGTSIPKDHVTDGISLVPTLTGKKGKTREWIYSYLVDRQMLRTKRWLLEGDGKIYDCGDNRDHIGYRDVTDSEDPDALAAKMRFREILATLPPAPGRDDLVQPRRKKK